MMRHLNRLIWLDITTPIGVLLEDTIRKSSQGYLNWILGIYQATTEKATIGLKVRVIEDADLQDMIPVNQKINCLLKLY